MSNSWSRFLCLAKISSVRPPTCESDITHFHTQLSINSASRANEIPPISPQACNLWTYFRSHIWDGKLASTDPRMFIYIASNLWEERTMWWHISDDFLSTFCLSFRVKDFGWASKLAQRVTQNCGKQARGHSLLSRCRVVLGNTRVFPFYSPVKGEAPLNNDFSYLQLCWLQTETRCRRHRD